MIQVLQRDNKEIPKKKRKDTEPIEEETLNYEYSE